MYIEKTGEKMKSLRCLYTVRAFEHASAHKFHAQRDWKSNWDENLFHLSRVFFQKNIKKIILNGIRQTGLQQ